MHRPWLALSLLILATLLASQDTIAARKVSANRECATCHIMWLTDFNQSDISPLIKYDPTPTVSSGKQDIASTERMCFSCHDGFVLDSRFMWKQGGHSHPVGVVPSDKVRIPTVKGKQIFPLNNDGKLYCGSCHTAHGVDWEDKESPIFLREKNVDSSLCIACHLNRSTGTEHGNHPLFKPLANLPEVLKQKGAKFSKAKEVICQSCHKPHAADNKKILVTDNKDSRLCINCHKEKKSVLPSKHNMSVTAKELENSQGHKASQSGPCGSCHIPHNATGPSLWSRTIDNSVSDLASATCLTCHADKEVVNNKTVGDHSHPVGRSITKLGIQVRKGKRNSKTHKIPGNNSQLPLFDKNGQRNSAGKLISCASCHDPHTWSQDHTKAGKIKDDGNGQNSFLRIAEDKYSSLCLSCHLDKREIISSKHDINRPQNTLVKIAKTGRQISQSLPLASRSQTLAPLCNHCHTPHNAKGGSLRSRGKQEKDLAPIESLCKDCHQSGEIAGGKTVAAHSHPLDVSPDSMKKHANLPLFDRNGSRDLIDGVMDCATCHDPHRWSQLKNQPSDVEGDGNNSFLRLSSARDSKLCQQCHIDKGQVLGTDHDLSRTAAKTKNALGQSVAASGPCAQCHAIHNPKMTQNLWARTAGMGQDPIEQQCRSCHNKDGPASTKIPPALQHPKTVTVWSEQARKIYKDHSIPVIPVFDQQAQRSESGSITCASCHDPHTWSAKQQKQKSRNKNVEGDAMSSFLRNANSSYIVCADCHGEDAIYRYKYFHSEASRIKHPLYK